MATDLTNRSVRSEPLPTPVRAPTLWRHPLMVCPPVFHERLPNVLAKRAGFGD
jgi:hypothetical protein